MSRVLAITFLCFFVSGDLFSQESDTARKGIHEEENEFYSALFPGETYLPAKSAVTPATLISVSQKSLTGKV